MNDASEPGIVTYKYTFSDWCKCLHYTTSRVLCLCNDHLFFSDYQPNRILPAPRTISECSQSVTTGKVSKDDNVLKDKYDHFNRIIVPGIGYNTHLLI